MTIDEAIVHAREVATIQRNNKKLNDTLGPFSPYYNQDCVKCAQEHDQLAEWLEELKQYRAIGTPEECLQNKDFLRFLANSMNQKKFETYLRIYNAVEKEGRDE